MGIRWIWFAGAAVLLTAGLGLGLFSGMRGEPAGGGPVAVKLPPLAQPPAASPAPALLLPAPDPGLFEDSPDGPLPKVGRDGRQAWQAYARPFDRSDKRPRIALVVTGLGLDRTLSQQAVDRLPGGVTLGFDPYGQGIKDAMSQARSLGHEALMDLPLEPLDYPRQDPGPLTLLVSLGDNQNFARLNRLMGEASGYVGLVAIFGGRFTAEKTALLPVLDILKRRGLMLVDDKPPETSTAAALASLTALPWAAADRVVDADIEPVAIDQMLHDLETIGQRNGAALAVAALSPALIDRAASWVPTLDAKGLVLAPASAIANRQSIPPSAAQ